MDRFSSSGSTLARAGVWRFAILFLAVCKRVKFIAGVAGRSSRERFLDAGVDAGVMFMTGVAGCSSLRRRVMFIAEIRRSIRPPSGGPCPSVFAREQQSCLDSQERMALLRRAEHPAAPAINIALLTEGRNLLTEGGKLRAEGRSAARDGVAFLALLIFAPIVQAQSVGGANPTREAKQPLRVSTPRIPTTGPTLPSTARTALYFESIRKSPPRMLAFFLAMPKGADLHNHLSGGVYAESYIQWAADKGLCVNKRTMTLSAAPCDQTLDQVPASGALSDTVLYRQLVDAWSMRHWEYSGQSGHDQFFDSFGKFGAATSGETGRMLAEAAARAARAHVTYLELMLTPDGGVSSQIGQKVGWDGDFEGALSKLKSNDIDSAAAAGVQALRNAEADKDRLLNCGAASADPGCSVTIRYVAQVSRGAALGPVFAQMVTGFALAGDPNSKVVALNLVQAEDSLLSMQNFKTQMEMLDFLRPKYPKAHITLHAGELAPGLVPPEGMSFHVRDSVVKGHAERIGHGVSIMHEDDPYGLLRELARRNVMIEICLTSNDLILGVKKDQHPLATYLKFGVPVALATDDAGVARSEIAGEFLKAAEDQGLGYVQLKTMARTSLEHAFLPGASLWADPKRFAPARECSRDILSSSPMSNACAQYLAGSEKARLQFKLEQDFKKFEGEY